ncbi:peroxisomal membrane protein pex14 [Friedmanniomyces endolithicus]|nr:peroxisomal membrane protein pex14 [Friedmanniomyces endolithicus]
MVREELIDGAITFLQDASVASAPVEQKIAFLRSKNLTQEEIDASLGRVGQPPQSSQTQAAYSPQQQPQYRQQQSPLYNQSNGYLQQQPYWPQPPPEPPRRDWRDYFIMATLLGGVGYGLYWTAQRYITPLIAPPTPPQLEQDKSHIDASFDKAFALLDQLATDTQELKNSEKARTERLDQALSEVESVIGKMKEASEERQREAKGMTRELAEIREQIPKALEKEKKNTDEKLADLASEMRSLKTLVQNRMQQPAQAPQATPPPNRMYGVNQSQQAATIPAVNGTPAAGTTTPAPTATPAAPETNGASTPTSTSTNGSAPTDAERPSSTSFLSDRSNSASPYGRKLGGKAQIPQWQQTAKKRSEEAAAAKKEDAGTAGTTTTTTDSGTSTPLEGKPAEVSEEGVADV